MKLNRRRFFGAAAAGAAATPSLAREAAASFGESAAFGPAAYSGETMMAKTKESALEQVKRLADARRIAGGDVRPEDCRWAVMGNYEASRALRSVSDAGRHLIQGMQHDRQCRSRLIEDAKAAIAEYDRSGFLRYFL